MKKKVFSVFFILIFVLTLVSFAVEITENESKTESSADTSDNNLIRFNDYEELQGDQYIISQDTLNYSEKFVDGNVYVCATTGVIMQNSIIDGNLFIMSREVVLNDVAVNGSIYLLSANLTIKESYAKDLYLLGNKIYISGNYDREVKALGESVEIDCEIDGKALISGNNIYIKDKAKLYSEANIYYSGTFEQSELAVVQNINAIKNTKAETVKQYTLQDKIKDQIIAWIVEIIKTIIFVGFLIIFTKRNLEKFAQNKVNTVGKFVLTVLKGLFWFIIIPILAIAVMIISRGYLIGLSIISIVIYSVALYLSLQIVSVAIGSIIREKLLKGSGNFEFILSSIIVMSIIWLLERLPIVGGLVMFITIIASLGIIINFVFERHNNDENKIEENTVNTDKKEKTKSKHEKDE